MLQISQCYLARQPTAGGGLIWGTGGRYGAGGQSPPEDRAADASLDPEALRGYSGFSVAKPRGPLLILQGKKTSHCWDVLSIDAFRTEELFKTRTADTQGA